MVKRARLAFLIVVVTCAVPARSLAQSVEQVATAPPNIVLANYDSVPVGPFGGLEGSSYAARVGYSSAAWFNPAGLSRQSTAQISGSAGVYQRTSVSPQALPNRGGSAQQLPNFVGFTVPMRGGLTAGVALVTTNAWSQETDADLITSRPASQERFAYSADSEYSRRVAAVGVGYHGSSAWRVGGGFAFSMMDLRLVQSASDRVADGTGLSTLLVTARARGLAVQLRTQAGAGTPPTVLSRPFGGLSSASDGVVNAAVGGHVRVMSGRDFRVHGGFATSRSPVGAADKVFNKVDFSSWTVGGSGTWAKLQFSAGFNHRAGTANDVLRRNLLNGDPLHTDIDVRTASLIYSIAYQF